MGQRRHAIGAAGVTLALLVGTAAAAADPTPIPRSMLCVTDGAMSEAQTAQLFVDTPQMRAVLIPRTPQEIQARFTYLGPTSQVATLGSGQVRRQFGLKLRAEDGCNLVYAMWRFAPKPALVVSVKSNPSMHSSKACRNGGYRNLTPQRAEPVDAPGIGRPHLLAARMVGSALRVRIDGRFVWTGDVGPEAMAANGPVGIRSDNARLRLTLLAPLDGAGGGARTCEAHGGEGE